MLEFTVEDWSAEDIARLRGIYEPLAESVRGLVDATIRSEADAETVAEVTGLVDAAVARLRPILLTAFSSLAGFLPLLFASGAGAASREEA